MGEVDPIREDMWALFLCLVSDLKGYKYEALSLVYTHLTLSSLHERKIERQREER